LHVDIRRRGRAGVPHDTMHVLPCGLLLGQCHDRLSNHLEMPNHLELEFRQLDVARELVKSPLPIVVRTGDFRLPSWERPYLTPDCSWD
jgi:hypothetical protein